MITNKEDFTKKRKTRLEVLEERIETAEKMIDELNQDLKEEGMNEISKLETVLRELKEMKQKMTAIVNEDNQVLENELTKLSQESLLVLNNDKIRIGIENESLKKEKQEKDNMIKKLQEQLLQLNMSLQKNKKREEELLETNAVLEDKVKNLKSKAYGYDIAKKFEIHHNKMNNEKKINNQIDPNRNKAIEDDQLAYNLWERENTYNTGVNKYPSRLEDLAKQKGLWIGNSTSNIEKLVYDVDSANKKKDFNNHSLNNPIFMSGGLNSVNNKYSNSLNSNMRKISPMILNNK